MGKTYYSGKVVLVTGAAGSIGSELTRALLTAGVKVVRAFDNNETGLFDLAQDLDPERLRLFIGDVRERDRLLRALDGVDVVFHAAALKHVPMSEYNPFDAVKTNVIGTQNVLEASLDRDVEKVVTVSTDKAVNPQNVLGATKLLAERLTTTSGSYRGSSRTVFTCVRFGNVLDSRGSVIPLFRNQIKMGGPITLTSRRMTRFIISIRESIDLILRATAMAQGGEIFILPMPAVRIADVASVLVGELETHFGWPHGHVKTKIIGPRPGEKVDEELMTGDEAAFAVKRGGIYVLDPQRRAKGPPVRKADYVSKHARKLSRDQIRRLLHTHGIV